MSHAKIDWTPQQIALVRSMRAAGCTVEEIRQKLGGTRSMASVHKLIFTLHIPRQHRDRRRPPPGRSIPAPKGSTLPPLASLSEA